MNGVRCRVAVTSELVVTQASRWFIALWYSDRRGSATEKPEFGYAAVVEAKGVRQGSSVELAAMSVGVNKER